MLSVSASRFFSFFLLNAHVKYHISSLYLVLTSSLVFQGLPYSYLKTQSYSRWKWHHLVKKMMHVIKTLEKNKNAWRNGRVVFCIMFEVVDILIDGIPCTSKYVIYREMNIPLTYHKLIVTFMTACLWRIHPPCILSILCTSAYNWSIGITWHLHFYLIIQTMATALFDC